MRARSSHYLLICAATLLAVLPLVGAHVDEHMAMEEGMSKVAVGEIPNTPAAISHVMESYFRHGKYGGWNLAHAILMAIAWTIIMPLAIMLSVARSRLHLPAQFLFHVANALGVFTGFVYNRSTPDLYEGNVHHPLGWAVVVVTIIWTVISIYTACGEAKDATSASELANSPSTDKLYELLMQYDEESRNSRDSGQGTERNSSSLFRSRQNSTDLLYQKPEEATDDLYLGTEAQNADMQGLMADDSVGRFFPKRFSCFIPSRAHRGVRFTQIVLEKFLLLLGFAALLSGFVVTGGLFRERQIFSGLAHYIKGGIFFWYGLLTLGRWMGAFAEFGWAWNVRPQPPLVSKWKSRIPSAEFTESFVIWLYGATNVFLEHLNSWGKAWSPEDLEHVSITLLFFGGGLLGIVVESNWARDLMSTPVVTQTRNLAEKPVTKAKPPTNRVPMNPMPATTIMLLGMMMGAHHQHSMTSTMMHAQWGGLFTAFALARGVTYILMFLKPPTSYIASRPPSELVASFCLTSGGIMFMNSAADTVAAIEDNGLDAMTIFTLCAGLTGLVMAWAVAVFAVKGWAMRRGRAIAVKNLA